MNPYLGGIMALSQLTPEQFDTGMQRFQQIQGMQPQGLSALQARQSGLTANMTGGQGQLGQLSPDFLQKSQEREQRIANAVPAGFVADSALNPGQAMIGQAIPTAKGYTNPQTGEKIFISTRGDNVGEITRRIAAPEGFQPPPPQPLNERQIGLSRLQNGITQGPQYTGVYTGEVKDSSGNVVRPALADAAGSTTTNQFPANQYYGMGRTGNPYGIGTGGSPYTQPYFQSSFTSPMNMGYGSNYRQGLYMPRNPYGGGYGGKGGYSPQPSFMGGKGGYGR